MDMAAISDDTAALVAAQLTVAWATRAGVGKPDPAHPFESQIASVYERFRSAVREAPIRQPMAISDAALDKA
jgi:hypothetical protein